MKPLNIIVAVDQMWGFAENGKIPWHFPEDLKRFKNITTGHICIMGRTTFEDIGAMRGEYQGDVLPGRKSIVLSSDPDYTAPGAYTATSLTQAVNQVKPDSPVKIFAIGGSRVFTEALPHTTKIYLTKIHQAYQCDRHFPYKDLADFTQIEDETTDKLSYQLFLRKKS